MIGNILKEITSISASDESLNTENYLDSLTYLDNLYKLIIILQKFLKLNDVEFLPSFKSRNISERLGLPSTAEENEMRYFKVKSDLFLGEQDLINSIIRECDDICEKISSDVNILTFTLK